MPAGAASFATIVPTTYSTSTRVLEGTILDYTTAVYEKFLVLDENETSKWKISTSGYLMVGE